MNPGLSKNLVLIGGRGCGKSAISRRLQRFEKRFSLFSLDALIRYECEGQSIPQIVDERGWRGFRDVEREVVRKAGAFPGGALIDAGGGVVVELDEEDEETYGDTKVAMLKKHGLVVYLQRDTRYLVGRIANDPNRPALSDQKGFEEIMARRDPWYRAAADLVFPCEELGKTAIAERILRWFLTQS